MKGGPKSSLRPFLHRALQLFNRIIWASLTSCLWELISQKSRFSNFRTVGFLGFQAKSRLGWLVTPHNSFQSGYTEMHETTFFKINYTSSYFPSTKIELATNYGSTSVILQ